MAQADDIIVELRAALPGLRARWPIRSLASNGRLRFRRSSRWRRGSPELRACGSTFVSVAALKPYIGERVWTEAVIL
jgi:hypothetical protein